MKPSANKPCPCHSQRKYKSCCGPILKGKAAPTPEALMRSRYTAYASGMAEYIVRTTHPAGPQYQNDKNRWTADINAFCQGHQFTGLIVHKQRIDDVMGTVHFTATLEPDGTPSHLEEHSVFYRIHDQWLYWGPSTPSSD